MNLNKYNFINKAECNIINNIDFDVYKQDRYVLEILKNVNMYDKILDYIK